jgi:adenylosuccinate synthase
VTLHFEQIDVVVGGQYGSEGKGAVAGALVQEQVYDCLIRVAGPNAGHTTVDHNGIPRALRQIPAAGVRDHEATLHIAPGSELDITVLQDDIDVYAAAGVSLEGRLYVSGHATIVTDEHHAQEQGDTFGQGGSTRKGVGAARAARAMRKAPLAHEFRDVLAAMGATVGEPPRVLAGGRAMIEGTQGYWLGAHAGMYPYCTSSDCRAIDFLAMADVTWNDVTVYVVFRTYPIRIAGNSGPLRGETTWEAIGRPPEFTTVTKKMRRVGQFEPELVETVMQANRIGNRDPVVAATFADYLDPEVHWLDTLHQRFDPYHIAYIGFGPADYEWFKP